MEWVGARRDGRERGITAQIMVALVTLLLYHASVIVIDTLRDCVTALGFIEHKQYKRTQTKRTGHDTSNSVFETHGT